MRRPAGSCPAPKSPGQIQSIAFSPAAPVLGIGTADGKVYQWDTGRGVEVGAPITLAASNVLDIGYSPDGKLMVAGLRDGTTRLLDLESGQQVGTSFPIEGGDYTVSLFTARGDLLINYVGTATEWPTGLGLGALRLPGRWTRHHPGRVGATCSRTGPTSTSARPDSAMQSPCSGPLTGGSEDPNVQLRAHAKSCRAVADEVGTSHQGVLSLAGERYPTVTSTCAPFSGPHPGSRYRGSPGSWDRVAIASGQLRTYCSSHPA